MERNSLHSLIQAIPKAELHVHIEGTFEPELIFKIAERNKIGLKYPTIEALKAAYAFNNLQEFLDIYYAGANVLLHEQDFYELTMAYLRRCKAENIVHTEIFFDPQTHTHRGIAPEIFVNGIKQALDEAQKKWGITSRLIPNFLRHLSEEDAIDTFKKMLSFKQHFTGFGLDSSEIGHPPSKFERVFRMVRNEGFKVVAHAGEEGSAQNIYDSLHILQANRIDHGVRSIENAALLQELAARKIPLTVCPLSNLKLKVVTKMEDHPLKKLLEHNIVATVNSDDPAYFGGYLNQNFIAVSEAFNFSKTHILQLAKNAFIASFISEKEKKYWTTLLNNY